MECSLLSTDAAGREKFLLATLGGIEKQDNYAVLLAIAETEAQLDKRAEAHAYAERALAAAPNEYKAEIATYLEGLF